MRWGLFLKWSLPVVGAALTFAVAGSVGEAHKPIASKYTYNDDVFPILRDRCGKCHVPGGVAPMSLMTYRDTVPWAESIRAELLSGHMPPFHAEEGFGEVRTARTLTTREMDVLLVWASGGTPAGPTKRLPAVTLARVWSQGEPDLVLQMPEEVTIPAEKLEETREFVLPTGTSADQWVRLADLLPGNATVVRSAVIAVKGDAAADEASAERVLALWVPGADAPPASDAAVRLPAGADLVLRVRYKKTWRFEGKPVTDRSSVGLYFSKSAASRELRRVTLDAPVTPGGPRGGVVATVDRDEQIVAFGSDSVPANVTVQMQIVRPDGRRVPLIRVNARPDWQRRYWFEKPISAPKGSRIEATTMVNKAETMLLTTVEGSAPKAAAGSQPLKVWVNVVPAVSLATRGERN